MDKKEKALRFGISILESVSDLLTAAVVGILLVAGLIHYFNWKYDREQELNPPETATPVIATPEPVSPELLKVLDQQSTELVDGRYLITLEPYSDIPLNVYRTIKHADGKPFRITLEDQWAESGDGSCYCILNGEKIPTLEDLASRSYKLTQRLHTEEVLTPEELAVWDRYHELEESRRTTGEPQDVTQALADELGMSRDDAFGYSYNIFRLTDGNHHRLAPYDFWDNIVGLIAYCEPEETPTPHGTLDPAMRILIFTIDYHLHLEDQEKLNQMMTEAYDLLSEDLKNQFPVHLPYYINLIGEIMSTYPENRERYDELTWISDFFNAMMVLPGHAEDWENVKTALLYAAEQAENKAS